MPRHIKTAALAGQQEESDANTRAAVEAIIADVKARGDAAVRELSARSDPTNPQTKRDLGNTHTAIAYLESQAGRSADAVDALKPLASE